MVIGLFGSSAKVTTDASTGTSCRFRRSERSWCPAQREIAVRFGIASSWKARPPALLVQVPRPLRRLLEHLVFRAHAFQDIWSKDCMICSFSSRSRCIGPPRQRERFAR
jgi:hypothetical protein